MEFREFKDRLALRVFKGLQVELESKAGLVFKDGQGELESKDRLVSKVNRASKVRLEFRAFKGFRALPE